MENSERNPLPQLKSKRAETSVRCCQRTLWPPLLHALHLPGTEKPIKILAGLLPRPGTTTSFSTFKYYFVWSRATVKYNRNKMSFKVPRVSCSSLQMSWLLHYKFRNQILHKEQGQLVWFFPPDSTKKMR